jgi:hypothetical protein
VKNAFLLMRRDMPDWCFEVINVRFSRLDRLRDFQTMQIPHGVAFFPRRIFLDMMIAFVARSRNWMVIRRGY